MIRPWHIWFIFLLLLVLVFLAMGHITVTVLQLDQAEAKSYQQTVVEERVRLALWRMDSALTQMIAQENILPYFFYNSFYPTERAYTRMFSQIKSGEILFPSPLLTQTSPYIQLHFQIAPNQHLSSPQVPEGNMLDLAEAHYVSSEEIKEKQALLQQLHENLNKSIFATLLPPTQHAEEAQILKLNPQKSSFNHFEFDTISTNSTSNKVQLDLNDKEWQGRNRNLYNSLTIEQQNWNYKKIIDPEESKIDQGIFQPLWHGEKLILARKVLVHHEQYIQGFWLNWPEVEKWLQEEVRDLLPKADFEPLSLEGCQNGGRQLATLPIKVLPGEILSTRPPLLSSVRISLMLGWGCVFLAIFATGFLLQGAVALSERRGDFVSAVTHELRTPLTTFRMYTEMLAEQMVKDPVQQKKYLKTLQTEADRLGHLVENVLSYARLERGRLKNRSVAFPVVEFLQKLQDRFEERAKMANIQFLCLLPSEELHAFADPSAVEQILFNLVDNACKYAYSGQKIELSLEGHPHSVYLWIRDYGPGVSLKDRKRLFRPFSKSAHEAAQSAPGVGLGLALSRRLARSMKGELLLVPQSSEIGARFLLKLARA